MWSLLALTTLSSMFAIRIPTSRPPSRSRRPSCCVRAALRRPRHAGHRRRWPGHLVLRRHRPVHQVLFFHLTEPASPVRRVEPVLHGERISVSDRAPLDVGKATSCPWCSSSRRTSSSTAAHLDWSSRSTRRLPCGASGASTSAGCCSTTSGPGLGRGSPRPHSRDLTSSRGRGRAADEDLVPHVQDVARAASRTPPAPPGAQSPDLSDDRDAWRCRGRPRTQITHGTSAVCRPVRRPCQGDRRQGRAPDESHRGRGPAARTMGKLASRAHPEQPASSRPPSSTR